MYILGCSLSTWRIIWLPGQKKVTGDRNQVFLTGRTTLTLKPKSFHTARRPDLGRRYVGLNKLQMVPRPHWSQNRQAYANSSASAHALSRNRKVNSQPVSKGQITPYQNLKIGPEKKVVRSGKTFQGLWSLVSLITGENMSQIRQELRHMCDNCSGNINQWWQEWLTCYVEQL